MSLYTELIRTREQRDRQLEAAADRLLLEGGDTAALSDEMSSVSCALQLLLSSFDLSTPQITGCDNTRELIESTLDCAGVMSEEIDLSDRAFLRSTDWILAQSPDGRALLLKPSLLGYSCTDAELKRTFPLRRTTALQPKGWLIHRPLSSDSGSVKGIVQLILRLITPRDLIRILLCTALIALLGLAIPAIHAWALHTLLPQGSQAWDALIFGAALFITIGSFQSITAAIKENTLTSMRIRISTQVEAALMAKLLLLPYSYFSDASAGRISKKIQAGHQLSEKIITVFLDTSFTLLFSLVYVPQMFHYGPALCLPALMILLAKIILSVFSFIAYARNNDLLLETDAEINSFVYSVIRGIQKIKSMHAQSRIYAKWAVLYQKRLRLSLDPPVIMKLRGVFLTFLTSLCTVVLLSFAAASGVSREDYMAFNASYGLVVAVVSQLTGVMESIFLMAPLVRQVNTLLDVKMPEGGNRRYVHTLKGRITLEHVNFQYPDGGKSALHDISIDIRPGQKIAIVGESGSGKSTLLKLLLGLEQPQSGRISYDGHSLKDLDPRSLRKRIGCVMQFSRVIPGTLYENIAFSSPVPITQEQAWLAAEKAAIADDIRALKLQMDTEISESGTGGFSGGQRQRLLLARALVSSPKVLFLDEATSALDNLTQKKVLDALYRERSTTIMVAHRLSTITDCDSIIMLEHGRIVEQGTYQELLERNGKFSALVQKQQE